MLQQLDALLRFDLVHFDQILQPNMYEQSSAVLSLYSRLLKYIFIGRIVKTIRKYRVCGNRRHSFNLWIILRSFAGIHPFLASKFLVSSTLLTKPQIAIHFTYKYTMYK